jgi:hypothetical protein
MAKTRNPDNHCWDLWRKALANCFLRPNDPHQQLRNNLGDWILQPDCEWYYSPLTGVLLQAHNDTWIHRERNLGNQPIRFQGFRRTPIHSNELPINALPTTAYGNNIVKIQATAWINIPTPCDNEPQWWNEVVHIPTNLTALLDGLPNGTAVCVTDGSYKHTYGSAALIILYSIKTNEGVILVNQTPGLHKGMDAAYPTKLGGIYGCIAYINELDQQYQIMMGAITLACDCWLVILNVFLHSCRNPNQPQFDLVHSCRHLVQDSTISWNSQRVTGHQDNHVSYNELDHWGQLWHPTTRLGLESLERRPPRYIMV